MRTEALIARARHNYYFPLMIGSKVSFRLSMQNHDLLECKESSKHLRYCLPNTPCMPQRSIRPLYAPGA